ncbi:phage integrase SAM-like domain-containing protein [Salegentibacter sp. 24]|uniref:phage integrase SAM-like domain-containing protein n=1 Tax=Salegentibacter sp. 24 TaxID=2183986 RepID=UPI00293944C0|nr:phage integrase SAM-like domain-containing protein [Salegentibacter sp. 24]
MEPNSTKYQLNRGFRASIVFYYFPFFIILRAEQILSIRKAEYAQGKYGIKDKSKEKLLFLTFYDKVKEERYESKGNYDNWDAAQNHIEDYIGKRKISFEDIDEEFVIGFKKYLNKKARTK